MAETETVPAEQPVEQVILAGTDATVPDVPETPERKRDPQGRFSNEETDDAALDAIFKKNDVGEKTHPENKKKEQPAPEQVKSEQAKETGTKIPKALELDGFTAEDLQGMTPERIAALESKAAKRQSDIGKKLSERPKADTTATATPVETKADKAQSTYKEVAKSVGDLLGDDVGEALSGVLEKSLSPLLERLNRAEGLLQQRLEVEMENQVASLRGKLAEDFPPLKDDAVLKRVVERMSDLADPNKYSDLESVMRDACRYELFDDMVKVAKSTPRNDTSRNNGQPTHTARSSKPTAAKTQAERDDEALDTVFKKHGLSR